MAQVVRHFVFRHPLFKKERTTFGVRWQDSVYYLWWEFLRRSEGYRKTCEAGGKGHFAELYKDFGDVFATDFKTWWSTGDRGARLFAEPAIPLTVTPLTIKEIAALPHDTDQSVLLLIAVPMRLSKSDIKTRINRILKQKHGRKRGQRLFSDSHALYLVGSSVNIHATKSILATYDMRMNNPKMPLWRIGQELKLGTTLTTKELAEDGRKRNVAQKNALAAAASRKLKQARRIIAGVGDGRFPTMT